MAEDRVPAAIRFENWTLFMDVPVPFTNYMLNIDIGWFYHFGWLRRNDPDLLAFLADSERFLANKSSQAAAPDVATGNAETAPVELDMVVPDSIEPIEAWRAWRLDPNGLHSVYGFEKWEPGEPLRAHCRGKMYSLVPAADGETDEPLRVFQMVTVQPVAGHVWREVKHASPHEGCGCGIYAVKEPRDCPPAHVLGRVNLWGTVIPAERGYRAELAYPSAFFVPKCLVDDPTLLAFGVPIHETDIFEMLGYDMMPVSALSAAPGHRRLRLPTSLRFAIGVNLAAAAANLAMLGIRWRW